MLNRPPRHSSGVLLALLVLWAVTSSPPPIRRLPLCHMRFVDYVDTITNMPVDPIPLATTATLVSSRIIKELEHVKQEWTAFQRCNFPPDLVHCISLVRLCHHEMQEIADTTNRALLETLREETQIQLVLDLVVRQVETAVEDLKYLEAEVGAMRSGENHRRMEHRWRKVNMEIDVCSARWHCHTAWLEWIYVMDQ